MKYEYSSHLFILIISFACNAKEIINNTQFPLLFTCKFLRLKPSKEGGTKCFEYRYKLLFILHLGNSTQKQHKQTLKPLKRNPER